jgi:peptidoglycan/xylan/chitin deacetylase (PgdA/CDA1 family)
MLTYRTVNIITFALLAILLYIHNMVQPVHWWVFVLLPLLYTGVLAWGSTNIAAGFYIPVTCAVPTDKKVVALTFDDGPLPDRTPQLLDVLKAHQAPAAFFCIGERITGSEVLLQRIHEEGHLLGNHSYSHHFWFDLFGAGRMLEELRQTDAAMEKAIGLRPRFFRPPYGVTNPMLRKAIIRGGYFPLGWNIRSLDTVIDDEEKLLARITDRLRPGSIILLHDSGHVTLKILPGLIRHIHDKGYTIERIDKLLNIPAYA